MNSFIDTFTPTSDETKQQILTILKAWKGLLGGSKTYYLSGPLSTGKRYVDAVLDGGELSPDVLKSIMETNIYILSQVAVWCRKTHSDMLLMEPGTAVYEPTWKTDDYMTLWLNYIKLHVKTILLAPSWNYSVGSIGEVIYGLSLGLDVYDYEQNIKITPQIVDEKIAEVLATFELVEDQSRLEIPKIKTMIKDLRVLKDVWLLSIL